jgi:ketosteroid isomerase-like protein
VTARRATPSDTAPGGTARTAVLAFHACINAGDVDGLARLMAPDHRFVDSAGTTVAGKPACLEAWTGFFAQFPDYRNVVERIHVDGDTAVSVGRSECSFAALHGPALWIATVRDGTVTEWRVADDTADQRGALGIEG